MLCWNGVKWPNLCIVVFLLIYLLNQVENVYLVVVKVLKVINDTRLWFGTLICEIMTRSNYLHVLNEYSLVMFGKTVQEEGSKTFITFLRWRITNGHTLDNLGFKFGSRVKMDKSWAPKNFRWKISFKVAWRMNFMKEIKWWHRLKFLVGIRFMR